MKFLTFYAIITIATAASTQPNAIRDLEKGEHEEFNIEDEIATSDYRLLERMYDAAHTLGSTAVNLRNKVPSIEDCWQAMHSPTKILSQLTLSNVAAVLELRLKDTQPFSRALKKVNEHFPDETYISSVRIELEGALALHEESQATRIARNSYPGSGIRFKSEYVRTTNHNSEILRSSFRKEQRACEHYLWTYLKANPKIEAIIREELEKLSPQIDPGQLCLLIKIKVEFKGKPKKVSS